MFANRIIRTLYCLLLVACGTAPLQPNTRHLLSNATAPTSPASIPQTLKARPLLPPPQPISNTATYSVVVANLSAQEILFALARDAKINLDVHSGIEGAVTLNAINQTLPQILDRITKQDEMR